MFSRFLKLVYLILDSEYISWSVSVDINRRFRNTDFLVCSIIFFSVFCMCSILVSWCAIFHNRIVIVVLCWVNV